MNQPQPSKPVAPAPESNLKWLLIVLAIVIIGGGLYYYFGIYKGSKTTVTASPSPTKSITASPSAKTSASPTSSPSKSSSSDLTYTNTKYGFTLTFPATWEGYKMKEANIAGAEITYYINVPTTDKNATGDSTADAGFYSPFAISVYTLSQWNDVEASDGPHDTLITKNSQYAFGWSHANGNPPSDFNLDNDTAGIIASFKLSQ